MLTHSTKLSAPRQRPTFFRPRHAQLRALSLFHSLHNSPSSQRNFALTANLPRSTFNDWCRKKAQTTAHDPIAAFFETPEGLRLLHLIHVAAHLVLCLCGSASFDLLSLFFKLCGLDKYLAASPAALQRFSRKMETEISTYETEEKPRLALTMPPRAIVLCEDENFHQLPCLVAIEPVSGFIIAEQYETSRCAETWNRVVQEGISGLKVEVLQVTSDEATGIKKHTISLGAHHNTDLFHGQHEVAKGSSAALSAKVRRTQEAVETQKDTKTEAALRRATLDKEEMSGANRALSKHYHPFNLETGRAQSGVEVEKKLLREFNKMEEIAFDANLSEAGKKRIEKAKRLVPSFVNSIKYVHRMIGLWVATLGLSEELAQLLQERIIPGLYLQRAALKMKGAELKKRIVENSERLLYVAKESNGLWMQMPVEMREAAWGMGERCADLFQRSSSCVEGRNGYLSLRHHHLHKIRPGKLRVLTILSNYLLKGERKTTAAERFFGSKPKDLFETLCGKLPMPARPRSVRP